MNALEKAICWGLQDAQYFYNEVADDWLMGAPESFLQHEVALSIIKRTEHAALTELSPKKIAARFLKMPRGRKPNNSRKRFDVVIWRKSTDRIRGVVEIKRAFRFDPIDADARKIENYLKHANAARSGYLLVYSEMDSSRKRGRGAARRIALRKRFEAWASRLKRRGWAQVENRTRSPRYSEYKNKNWSWGYSLYRLDKK